MSQQPLRDEQIEQLNQPLDPRRVKHRPGGGGSQLSYLEGHDAINTANQIFGYGSWGYDLMGVEFNNVTDEKGEVIGGYYAARVKLTVAGCVPITEEGVCAYTAGRNARATIDSHDMARKGAITDALKRALRCYGDQFGNSLYNNGLVDGQPRNIANANRPTRPMPTAPVGQPDATRRPAAPTPAPVTSNPAAAPAAIAPTPVAPRPAATVNPAPVARTNNPATEQQRSGIRRIALNRKMTEQQLESLIKTHYGCSFDELSATDASNFIQVLQSNAA